jgi:hypothetical protein
MKKIIFSILLFAAFLCAGIWAPPAKAELAAFSPGLLAGRPIWYQDTVGLTLANCLDANLFCFGEGIPADPATADETFYWMAEAFLPAPLNGILVLALETNPPNAVFARIRIRADITIPGDYTVQHPFGTITINVPAAGASALNTTQDVGDFLFGDFSIALLNSPVGGIVNADGRSIGPFLTPANGTTFVDPVSGFTYLTAAGVPTTVTGSPVGQNFFSISGPDGNFTTDQFILVGKLAFCGPTNVAPVAVADSVALTAGAPTIINVIANDTDLGEGGVVAAVNPATVVIVTPPTLGTAVANANGTVTYTPNAGTLGPDSFTYTVSDFCGLVSNVATVNLNGLARAEFRARTGRWTFKGTSSAPVGIETITIRRDSATGPVIGTTVIQTDGSWFFSGKPRVSPGPTPRMAHISSDAGMNMLVPFNVR